jgi:hypothetical protein
MRMYDRHYHPVVDQTGRIVRAGKRGAIPATLRPILKRCISMSTRGATRS